MLRSVLGSVISAADAYIFGDEDEVKEQQPAAAALASTTTDSRIPLSPLGC